MRLGIAPGKKLIHIFHMKLNSRESLETGSKLIQEYGSWSEVRRHSLPNKHGVLVLQVERDPKSAKPAADPTHKR